MKWGSLHSRGQPQPIASRPRLFERRNSKESQHRPKRSLVFLRVRRMTCRERPARMLPSSRESGKRATASIEKSSQIRTLPGGLSNCGRQVIKSSVSAPAIVIDSLEKWFPPTYSGWRAFLQPFAKPNSPALRGISLEVAEGEAVALLGANGAGKTTLLRVLATLLLPTRGRAQIAGHDAVSDPAAVRRQLGYHAGRDLGFYSRLTGRQNLRFFGRLNHLTDATIEGRTRALGERFQLGEALDRQTRSLSSGTI